MFLDALSKLGTATVNIPLAQIQDPAQQLIANLGVSVPGQAMPYLTKMGLFDHKVAENLSKGLFEVSGKTLTGHWMDATGPFINRFPEGVPVGWHRIAGHNFLTDSVRTIQDKNLSFVDFHKHLATDIVTSNGLPIFPESMIRGLADMLGVSVGKVMPWVSFNILDIGASGISVWHAGANVISLVHGTAHWGIPYALNTLGLGGVEVTSGLISQNPILIGAGAVDIACGTITAYKYYTQPFLFGVPVTELLGHAAVGVGLAGIVGCLEVFLRRHSLPQCERLKILSERIGTGGVLSAMSAIGAPVSITAALGITGFKLARTSSEQSNNLVQAIPVTGQLSREIDQYLIEQYIGRDQYEYLEDEYLGKPKGTLDEHIKKSIRAW
jgi:hypothetical protein